LTLMISWPLVSRIARTVMVASGFQPPPSAGAVIHS
jgi:hypothetical protein